MRDCLLRHVGRTFCVLGGGPSLIDQLPMLPADAVYLSANEHGAKARTVDYIVAIDDIEDKVRPYGVPVIGPHRWTDIRVTDYPQYGFTGQYACWVAWLLGASLVIVAGMDLYRGGTYWHDAAAPNSAGEVADVHHVGGWRDLQRSLPIPVRAAGGPLVEVMGRYDPSERVDYAPAERLELLRVASGTRVQFLRDWTYKGTDVLKGQILELPKPNAASLLERRVVRLHGEVY